jgi:hypothetical protein
MIPPLKPPLDLESRGGADGLAEVLVLDEIVDVVVIGATPVAL